MYPDECVQTFALPWWVQDEGRQLVRGRLLKTFVPYPEQKPHRLVPEGRGDKPTQHERALVRIEPFRVGSPIRVAEGVLPVAALPLRAGEAYFVHRGKQRPAVVVAEPGDEVARKLVAGSAKWLTAPTVLVAPYYGRDQDGTRGGWPAPLAERIKRAEYNRFVWDKLPIPGPEESILRLDHMFAVGADPANYELTPHRLNGPALALLDEWIRWLLTGSLEGSRSLGEIRELLLTLPDASSAKEPNS